MTRILNSDRNRIDFQDDVDSFPIDENFGAYKNRHNELVDLVDAISSPVAGNEVTNGDFDGDASWTKGTGWTIAAGVATKAPGSASDLSQTPPLGITQTYTVIFTISSYTAGSITPKCGTAAGTARSSAGTFSEEITCTGSGVFALSADAAFDGSIDNVIVNGAEIISARPYHPSLRARLDSMWASQANYLKEGGEVTVNAIDTDQLDIAAGEARVGGIDVKWAAQTTSAATPSVTAGFHRIDTIVINSDSTISQVLGSEVADTANPAFPGVSNAELTVAVIYVNESGTVDLTGDLFELKPDNHLPNYFIAANTTINQGQIVANNFIVHDCTLTVDVDYTGGGLKIANGGFLAFKCTGNFALSDAATLTVNKASTIYEASNTGEDGGGATQSVAGDGGVAGFLNNLPTIPTNAKGGSGAQGGASGGGAVADGGGGGGGAGSLAAAGGDGGAGGSNGSGSGDGAGGTPGDLPPSIVIIADNVDISADIDISGAAGNNGSAAGGSPTAGGGGGAGGTAGGNIIIIAIDEIYIDAGVTLTVDGGDGGDGGVATTGASYNGAGGGGGGGAGGLIVLRARVIDNNGSTSLSGGAGGAGGNASGGAIGNFNGTAGSNGSDGVFDSALYQQFSADFTDGFNPLQFIEALPGVSHIDL